MKIKVYVLDFEVPRRTKRIALLVGVPAALLVGVVAVAYAAGLTTFSSGEALSAATMNANFSYLQAEISGLQTSSVPAGTIIAYAGPISAAHPIPAGWLLCDGSQVSRTTYASLLDAIGVSYGTGDQVTTFNLPDLRGYFLRGLDTTAAATNDPNVAGRTAQNVGGNTGAEVGTYEADEFALHNHNYSDPGHVHQTQGVLYGAPGGQGLVANFNESVGVTNQTSLATTNINFQAQGGAETRPKNVAVNYIIKF